jgi:hypothetical protein
MNIMNDGEPGSLAGRTQIVTGGSRDVVAATSKGEGSFPRTMSLYSKNG